MVGNAIKYTTNSHITVRLAVGEPLKSSAQATQCCPVLLSVEDTGIGMSDAFLAHGMFTPFKQENPYADGTGLGLSIVKHIARGMGAKLDVSSKLGEGTTVQVRFIAEFVTDETATDVAFTQDTLPDWTADLKVDQLQLLSGPRAEADATDSPITSSVIDNAEEWLSCEINRSNEITHGNGTSLCGITEEDLAEWQRTQPKLFSKLINNVALAHSHLFVFGMSMASVTLSCGPLPVRPVFIHQPIGPRKLLRAIASDRSSTVSGDDQAERPSMPHPVERQISSDTARTVTRNARGDPVKRNSLSSDSLSLAQSRDSRSCSPSSRDGSETLSASMSTGATSHGYSVDASVASVSTGSVAGPLDGQRDARGTNDTILLVEDNEINTKFLIALVSKLKIPYIHTIAVEGRRRTWTMYTGP